MKPKIQVIKTPFARESCFNQLETWPVSYNCTPVQQSLAKGATPFLVYRSSYRGQSTYTFMHQFQLE